MKRRHLFEIADQPFCPVFLRHGFYRLLQYQVEKIYLGILPQLQQWLLSINAEKIVDLASGNGGPWQTLYETLNWQGKLELSDINPSNTSKAFDNAPSISWHKAPVDLNNPDTWPEEPLTLFSAFHHLSPDQAQCFLCHCVLRRQPVFIAEFTQRKISRILGMLLSPIVVWIDSLRIRPYNFTLLFFTYCVPILPLMYWWDGMISHWRTYDVNELKHFTELANANIDNTESNKYQFEIIDTYDAETGIRLTGIIGCPRIN